MSTEIPTGTSAEPVERPRKRVYAFVDGFNVYHALEKFEPAVPVPDPDRYQKYKWLCLRTLIGKFIRSKSEELAGVEYFTALPNWHNTTEKRRRHETYLSALKTTGVTVTLGEFKPKDTKCMARCGYQFQTYVEKQTDINIATKMIELAEHYDRAIIVTGDSDQVPTVRLLRKLYPDKTFAVLIPIGRSAKELQTTCNDSLKMTEQHLADSQLPKLIEIPRKGATSVFLSKPSTWP